jgi:hypothetical protein
MTYHRPGNFPWERNFLYLRSEGADSLRASFGHPCPCLKRSSSGLRRIIHVKVVSARTTFCVVFHLFSGNYPTFWPRGSAGALSLVADDGVAAGIGSLRVLVYHSAPVYSWRIALSGPRFRPRKVSVVRRGPVVRNRVCSYLRWWFAHELGRDLLSRPACLFLLFWPRWLCFVPHAKVVRRWEIYARQSSASVPHCF